MKVKITNKGLYWGLIATFTLLYLLVAFVSTLHAIDFFQLSNIGSLAILLGVAYEVGQASVLFSILMTKNKEKFLPWLLMILLTALQVTANVYASFKHMSIEGGNDWTYWYTSILKIFGVTGGTTETYQVIISWISGALLPIVALGMTALVAQNIKLITEEGETSVPDESIDASTLIAEVSKVRPTEDDLEQAEAVLSRKKPSGYHEKEIDLDDIKKMADEGQREREERAKEEARRIKDLMTKEPINSGIISDALKSTISPGIEKDEDEEKVTVEETKVVNDKIKVDVKTAEEEASPILNGVMDDIREPKVVIPALSDEEVNEMFQDELEGKLLEDDTEANHLLDLQDSLGNPEEPEKVIYEGPLNEETPKPEVEIKSNNGLMELAPIPDSTPPVKEETEDEKLERLRRIARENLKKK